MLVNGVAVDLQSSIIAGNTADGQPADLQLQGASIAGDDNRVFGPGTAAVPADTLIGAEPQLAQLAWKSSRQNAHHATIVGSRVTEAGNDSAEIGMDQRGAGFTRVGRERDGKGG